MIKFGRLEKELYSVDSCDGDSENDNDGDGDDVVDDFSSAKNKRRAERSS